MAHTYSDFTKHTGGIGYRLDFSDGQSYTTNPDGSGLFFHNGRGDRRQVRGNGQFSAHSMRSFKALTQSIVVSREEEIAAKDAWANMTDDERAATLARQGARNELEEITA